MKKLLLLTLSAGLLLTGCYKKEVEENNRLIAELQEELRQTSLNNALIITELQADLEGTIASNIAAANAALASAVAALEAADTANAATIATLESDVAEIELDLEAVVNRQAAYTAAAGQTNANLTALARAIGTLQDDVEDLEDDIDDLEDDLDDLDDDVNSITWTPTFSTQTVAFTQIGTSVTGTTSRVIAIGTTTNTITINSFEHAQTPVVDVNTDRDHADAIRATRVDTTYTGTVSGTTLRVGAHTVTGTLSNWIVIDNN